MTKTPKCSLKFNKIFTSLTSSSFIISFASLFSGTVEDVDMQSDLATVRIPCKNLPVMKLGQSSNLRPGEFVIAMGSPLALSNTITTGVVSSVARKRTELGLRSRDVPGMLTKINFLGIKLKYLS